MEEKIMKQGRTLEEVGRELERQRLARKDFVADTRSLEMVTDKNGTKLSLGAVNVLSQIHKSHPCKNQSRIVSASHP